MLLSYGLTHCAVSDVSMFAVGEKSAFGRVFYLLREPLGYSADSASSDDMKVEASSADSLVYKSSYLFIQVGFHRSQNVMRSICLQSALAFIDIVISSLVSLFFFFFQ